MKKYVYLAAVAVLSITVAGCSSQPTENKEAVEQNNTSLSAAGANNSTNSDTSNNPAENAEPGTEEPKIIYGEISEVIGNSITVKLLEIPTGPNGERLVGRVPGEGFGGQMTEEQRKQMEERINTMRGSGEVTIMENGNGVFVMRGENAGSGPPPNIAIEAAPSGGSGAPPSGGQGGPVEGTRRMRINMERKYTGQESEVIIPVGVPVVTMSRGENGFEEKEIALNKLSSGNILTVIYKPDGKTIERAFVTQNQPGGIRVGGQQGGGMVTETIIIRE